MRQTEVDGFDAVVVGLALADVRKAANAVVGFDTKLKFEWFDKRTEHVHQKCIATIR